MKETLQKLDLQKIFQYSARYALTEVGKNILLDDIQAESRNEAEYFLNLTTEAKKFLETQADISLNPQAELSETLNRSRIEGMILSPKEVRLILDLLINSRNLKQLFLRNVEQFPLIFNLANRLFVDKLLEKNITDIVDEYYEIKDSASIDLRKIRNEIREKKEHLQKVAESLLKKLSKQDLVQEELVTLRDGRIVLPIKTEYKRQIRGFIHSESASGLTTYIEPEETLELNNEILSLYFQEKREIERLMKKLTEEIAKVNEQLILNQSIVAQIDA
ncbi:MAG: endonuclease MutS2, partial [Ignavibacteria bacterium]|nr:endonuclease MutS2 [Ignavibacteria bacterium]